MKGPEAAAGVIEHPIQDDADAAGVSRIQQRPQRLIASQQWIHLVIIVGVITMIAG